MRSCAGPVFVMLVWIGLTSRCLATAYVNTTSGNWTDPATWGGGGWPQNAGDTAAIATGIVTINSQIPTISTVTINSGATLHIYGVSGDDRSITNAIIMQDGATISCDGTYSGSANNKLYGTIAVSGTACFRTAYAALTLYSVISGTGTLDFDGTADGNYNQRSIRLAADNTFNGDITWGARASYIEVLHPGAFGVKPALTVTVPACVGQGSDANRFYLRSTAGMLNTNVSVVLLGDALLPAGFVHSQGTIVSNQITLAGGTYMVASDGTGSRYNRGELVLANNTTSSIDRGWSTYGDWRQEGVITGGGSLWLDGGDGNGTAWYFLGNNTCTGTIRVISDSYADDNRTRCSGTNCFGLGALWVDGSGSYTSAVMLTGNATLGSDIRGRGHIRTDSYRLTATGQVSPFDTGYSTRLPQIGLLSIEDLTLGSDSQGCTYNWQYDEATNDILACATLQIGAAQNTLAAEWLGTSTAPLGEYVLMTYSGTDPSVGSWRVSHASGHKGRVWVDSANNRVMVKFWRAGTIVLFR